MTMAKAIENTATGMTFRSIPNVGGIKLPLPVDLRGVAGSSPGCSDGGGGDDRPPDDCEEIFRPVIFKFDSID